MDLVSSCKDKLQYFRIKELKDVLTQLGLSKQGKKQDLIDRILGALADDQASKTWAKRPGVAREDVARLVDDTYRKMQVSGATDLASKVLVTSDSAPLKPKEEVIDSFQSDMKVRCPCGNLLHTESMIRCEDPRCQIWQHISCVIIPEKAVDGIPPVPPQFYCELCRLSRADPFWSTVQQLVCPVKLATNIPTDGANPVVGIEKQFHLTKSDRELLSKTDFAVQVWCILLNDKVPFRMQWPQYADLQVNGMPVRALNRPGSQLLGANGRDGAPNISQYTKDGINKICITGCDARIFCVGVRLVKRRSLLQILNMIPKESDGERFEDALARVRRCVGGGEADNADSDSDLEVVADSFTINLRCPMSGSRMKIAGRFKPCVHMGCFDLESFVEMQQRSRKWQCPICLKNYSLENIIIDPYFNRITTMMQSCGEDTTEIEVKPDGCWRVKSDNERRDLKQWHSPDGSLFVSDEGEGEAKSKPETSKPIKQEGTGLKLGIRKNSNGVWEVSKNANANTLTSSGIVREKLENGGGPKVIPMSSSATGSGRDGDESVNQDGNNGQFDLSVMNGVEFDSIPLNLEPTHGFNNHDASAVARDADVIVLSDSDEENEQGADLTNGLMVDDGVNFVNPYGISDSYQQEPDLGAGGSSCLDFFSAPDDDFALWQMPATNHVGSTFQLFGSDGDGSDTLANNPHLSSANNCTTSMNGGYMLAPDASLNPVSFVPDSSIGHSHNDLNDGLVDNPLAFGGEDPSLHLFLPTRPSDISVQNDVRNQQDMTNGLHRDDWISLSLGHDGGESHGNSAAANGLDSRQQLNSGGGAVDPLAGTGNFLVGSSGSRSGKNRERSDSPFSFPRQKRSARQRFYLSIDSDSDSE